MIHIYSTISGTLIKIKRADCEDWGGRMNIEKIIQEIVADFSQKNYFATEVCEKILEIIIGRAVGRFCGIICKISIKLHPYY